MNRILCSIGALIGRPNGMDIRLLDKCMNRLKCDGYEFLMSRAWYDKIAEITDYLKCLDINMPVFHTDKNIGNLISRNQGSDTQNAIELFETNCKFALSLGCEKLVLHLWGGLDSDKNIEHNIKTYETLNRLAADNGLTLTVENIVCNQRDPMSHLVALAEAYPEIKFTFDTKMSEFHSQTDWLYKEEYSNIFPHIAHIHANDFKGGINDWNCLKTLHIGDGQVDFDAFFEFVKKNGYTGDFTVEAAAYDAEGKIDFDLINRSFERIRKLISKGS